MITETRLTALRSLSETWHKRDRAQVVATADALSAASAIDEALDAIADLRARLAAAESEVTRLTTLASFNFDVGIAEIAAREKAEADLAASREECERLRAAMEWQRVATGEECDRKDKRIYDLESDMGRTVARAEQAEASLARAMAVVEAARRTCESFEHCTVFGDELALRAIEQREALAALDAKKEGDTNG